jgi:hypothetical protein
MEGFLSKELKEEEITWYMGGMKDRRDTGP